MKKAIYLFAAAAFMASCNQEVLIDETTNAQPEVNRRIGFDTFVDKATRTTGTNSTELKDFYSTFIVNGWKTVGEDEPTCIFDNVAVNYITDADAYADYAAEWGETFAEGWYYQNVRYWDKMATSYQFCAYAPAVEDVVVNCSVNGTITIGTATAPVTVDGTNLLEQESSENLAYSGFVADFMTATSNDATDKVSLTFSHLQAKMNIRIKLDESITTAQDVSIQKIAIHNLGDKGYYTNEDGIGVSGWTLYTLPVDDEEDEEEVEEEEEEEVLPVDDEEGDATPEETPYILSVTGPYALNGTTDNCHNHYVLEQLLIPQTISKPANSAPQLNLYNEACIYVEYTIGAETFRSYSPLADIFIGEGEATTYSFEGGKQYTINVIVGPSPIEFTATVDAWETAEANQDMD